MNWKGARRSVLITGEGQPSAPTIAGNHDPLCMQGLVRSVQLPRLHGEVEAPTSSQPPRGAQGRRLLGPAALRTCPFASPLSQVRSRLGPGGYCRCSGNGVPRLACLRPAAWLKGRPSMAHLHQHELKTLARGQASRGGRQGSSSGTASSGWLARRRRDQGRVPREVPMRQAMTTKGAGRAPARAVSTFPLVQREQAQARASSKGIHFGATRPRPAEQQDRSHRGAQAGVTTRAFGRRGPTLVRISVLDVPLQNGQLLAPFPLNIWEEAQGICL